MVDFTDVLSKKAVDVEKPKPRPTGNYVAAIAGMPKQKKITVQGEEKPIISFACKIQYAMDDVDKEDLEAAGDPTSWMAFDKDVWLDTAEGEWALTHFLTKTLGIDPGEGKNAKSLGEMCAESPGRQLIITLAHRPYTNKEGEAEIGTRIAGTAKV